MTFPIVRIAHLLESLVYSLETYGYSIFSTILSYSILLKSVFVIRTFQGGTIDRARKDGERSGNSITLTSLPIVL